MKILAASLLIGVAWCSGAATAHGLQETEATRTDSFVAGDTSFVWVPQAHVSKAGQGHLPEAASASIDADERHVSAVIGDYVISLDQPRAAGRSITQSAPRTNADGLAVAMNERSGQLVLVPSRIKVFGIQETRARQLAKRGDGEVAYASDIDRTAIIRYASLAQAQAALAEFAKESGVEEASFDVIQHIYTAQ